MMDSHNVFGFQKKLFKEDGERKKKKWSMSGGEVNKLMKKRKLSGVKLGR